MKLKEFIRGFEMEKNIKRYPYRESLVNNPRSLINLEHLHAFHPDLPAQFLPLFESAAAEVVTSLKSKVAGESGEMEEPLAPDVQILLTSNEDPISIHSLGENPEDVPTGELPRNILLSIDRHLVQTIAPGTCLTLIGIYSIFQASIASTPHKGAVVGIEEANEGNSRAQSVFTANEVEEFKKFAAQHDAYEKICSKIAPSIFGNNDVEKAVACLLF